MRVAAWHNDDIKLTANGIKNVEVTHLTISIDKKLQLVNKLFVLTKTKIHFLNEVKN